MNKIIQLPGSSPKQVRIKQAMIRIQKAIARTQLAETRAEQAESRTESAKTRTEKAEARTEQAETRTEQAKARTEQAETRTEQAESALERITRQGIGQSPEIPKPPAGKPLQSGIVYQKSPLEQLTIRQREVLQLIVKGKNTKESAELLKISPKTVEYHRLKLMKCLNVHDIPGLVRFALRVELIPI
jgi:DNA-binding CsgD family transcriptional regulator